MKYFEEEYFEDDYLRNPETDENSMDDFCDYDLYDDYCSGSDIDWEEETYYAFGGTDYQAWRERGGDLDAMMDAMGF